MDAVGYDNFINGKEKIKKERDCVESDDEKEIERFDTKKKKNWKGGMHITKALKAVNVVNEEITPTESSKSEIVRENKEFERAKVVSNRQRKRMESDFGKTDDAKDIYGHTIDKHFEIKSKRESENGE